MGDGVIYYGQAGCGKTTKLIKLALEAPNPIILSFTNKAIESLKSRINDSLRDKCYTFDSYFNSYHNRDISHLADKTMFIEEYSMTPNKWVSKIYQAFTKYDNTVFLFDDTNQCDPVEKGRRIHYNYFDSVAISEMCPRRVQMKYKEGCSRYDIKTKDMLTKFLETGKVTAKFADRKPLYKKYLLFELNPTACMAHGIVVRDLPLAKHATKLSLYMMAIRKRIPFVPECQY